MIRSIRTRIILLYTLILTVSLLIFGSVLYHYVRSKIYNDVDELLYVRGQNFLDSLDSRWQLECLRAGRINAWFNQEGVLSAEFVDFTRSWVDQVAREPLFLNTLVQIFDARGKLLASSVKEEALGSLPKHNVEAVASGKMHHDFFQVSIFPPEQFSFRALTIPVMEKGKLILVMRVARKMRPVEMTMIDLQIALFLFLPVTIVIAGVLGFIFTRKALSPVEGMINTLRTVTSENLRARVVVPSRQNDEISRLAETFNQMIERLEKSFSVQREFIKELAHELNIPLSALKIERKDEPSSLHERRGYVDTITKHEEAIFRLTKIVENLELLAKFDDRTVNLKFVNIEIQDILRDVVAEFSSVAGRKGIEVKLNDEHKAVITGDNLYLSLLFRNLVDSALMFTESGGVRISVEKDNFSVRVSIADSGPGLTDEELTHVFERFYRFGKNQEASGFGLGLSIVKAIADAHRLNIEVRSKAGEGSIFTVVFPLNTDISVHEQWR